MKQKYTEPNVQVIKIQTAQLIAASGDTQTLGITNTEYSGSFNGHEDDSDWEDEGY